MDAIDQALQVLFDFYLDGFLALLAVAVVAPVLGVFLVLRRLPLLGLAIPQMAGSGQAGAFLVFGWFAGSAGGHLHPPGADVQTLGAFAGVALGLLVLVVFARDRRFLGVQAGIVYLVAVAAQELFYLECPYQEALAATARNGRLLTVDAAGRNTVLVTSAVALVAAFWGWRRLWLAAFDPDQARLNGVGPQRWLAFTLVLIGGFCGLCVPVVGPTVVLAGMLVPPALLRSAAPSLTAFVNLSVLASVLGAVSAFVVACTGLDWPPTPTLVLAMLLASWLVAAGAGTFGWLRRA